ncbi:MAG: isoprenyl transferase [Neisseriaceae bacterium]|nr:isoprenyl transferase [Neisseriaceae bacterium]MBR3424548.1 isoprenyl transferase [Neisseriaceae bacterium]
MKITTTNAIPQRTNIPRHIGIIMDGNGRWAKKRFMPRIMGHKKGVDQLEAAVRRCTELGVEYLTVFAFSTENWRRPVEEVSFLMGLFSEALKKKVRLLHKNNIRLKVIGRRDKFPPQIRDAIYESEALTANNTGLTLTVAADYGGRQDILNAVNSLIKQGKTEITEEDMFNNLSLGFAPEPDLFIRTGGEARISNFMLWQMAYAELYFTDALWPDFDEKELDKAIASFQKRERRFGRTTEQLPENEQRS